MGPEGCEQCGPESSGRVPRARCGLDRVGVWCGGEGELRDSGAIVLPAGEGFLSQVSGFILRNLLEESFSLLFTWKCHVLSGTGWCSINTFGQYSIPITMISKFIQSIGVIVFT